MRPAGGFTESRQRRFQPVLQWRAAERGQTRRGHATGGNGVAAYPFPTDFNLRFVGEALLGVGRVEEAIAVLRRCAAGVPNMSNAQFWLTLAYMENGQKAEARTQALEMLRLIPRFSISACPHLLACKGSGQKRPICGAAARGRAARLARVLHQQRTASLLA